MDGGSNGDLLFFVLLRLLKWFAILLPIVVDVYLVSNVGNRFITRDADVVDLNDKMEEVVLCYL